MSDWQETKLGEKIHVKHGFPFKSEYFSDSGAYVVLTPGNFLEEGGFKRNPDKDKWYTHKIPDEYLLGEGDIIVAMTEQSEGLLGSMAKVPGNGLFLHNQRLGLVTAKNGGIDLDFVYHLSKVAWVREQIRLTSSGSKVKHTSPGRLGDVKVKLPPIEVQRRVASILSKIDAKIELNNRINEQLDGMAKLLYDYWFVQFDFPFSAEQAAAMGRPELEGEPYRSSGGKMIYNPTLKREIPDGWSNGALEQIGVIVGGSTPSTKQAEYFTKNGTPWITPKDLSNNEGNRFIDHGATDVTEGGVRAASLRLLPAGTVLMSSRAPIGYLAVARNPVTTNQGFKSFVPSAGFSTEFIYFTLKHFMPLIEANASGSTFREVSGGTLKTVKIPIPDSEVVAIFTEVTASFSVQQSILEQQNQHLASLRDWLLPMLMNGQVSVGESKPSPKGP